MAEKKRIEKNKLIELVNERARLHAPPNTPTEHCQVHDLEPTHAPAPFPNWKWSIAHDPHPESSGMGVDALMGAVGYFQAEYDVAWPAAAPAKPAGRSHKR